MKIAMLAHMLFVLVEYPERSLTRRMVVYILNLSTWIVEMHYIEIAYNDFYKNINEKSM